MKESGLAWGVGKGNEGRWLAYGAERFGVCKKMREDCNEKVKCGLYGE